MYHDLRFPDCAKRKDVYNAEQSRNLYYVTKDHKIQRQLINDDELRKLRAIIVRNVNVEKK